MKSFTRLTAMLLAMVLTLSITVLADNSTENDKATIRDVITGATVTFDETNDDKINVTYTSNSLVSGSYYLVLMVMSDENGNYDAITEESITYIDQVQADESGTIRFTVYPSRLTTSVILITGLSDGLLKAAIVEAKYILGDVDGSGEVNSGDVTALLQYIVGMGASNNFVSAAADVDGSGEINSGDVTKLLQVIVGAAEL